MITLDLALQYAGKTRRPVFPCLASKRPACEHGFHDATSAPEAIRDLWKRSPGPLIGMPTGEASGVSVLDIDAVKHPDAGRWFNEHRDRLLPTLTVETRSGGWHCFYRNRPSLACTVKLFKVAGVDIRSTGGYVILWALHGTRTLMQADPAPWPDWLTPPPPQRPERASTPARVPDDASLAGLIRFAHSATEGERNSRLYWVGRRLRDMVTADTMTTTRAKRLMAELGERMGLPDTEVEKTAASAIDGGQA